MLFFNNSTKSNIAKFLGKDATTIAKEIKKHRYLKSKSLFAYSCNCALLKDCLHKPCTGKCSSYMPSYCRRRDCSPGACNGCSKINYCKLDRYLYNAKTANSNYLYGLKDSRVGINMTTDEAFKLGNIIKSLIIQGQSIYQILQNHPET